MKVSLYTDPRFEDHEVPAGHPERPARLAHLLAHFERCGLLADLQVCAPGIVAADLVAATHGQEHIQYLEGLDPASGLVNVDPDTTMGPHSLLAAEYAAGAVVDAVSRVLDNSASAAGSTRAFCAVRPPGHHAERVGPMGFCLYNSIALGARAALGRDDVERVAILDFDVHHGNGTVDIFQDDPRVLVCSSFQHPFYPHRHTDTVRPNIVNTPLAAGSGSRAFRSAIERDWLGSVAAHDPDLILVSAGFDAHRDDPLGGLELVDDDYRWVTELICSLARDHCNGALVSALEGGYNLDALASSAAVHVSTLSEQG